MTKPSDHSAVACVFPGQGSQRRGMGGDLFDRYPDLCAEADGILGYSVRELCLNDPERRLRHTAYTQPALFAVNALMWLDRAEKNPPPVLLAGHSLGELSALFAADCLGFADGLRLVKSRGALMAEAGSGGMTAVLGLGEQAVQAVIEAEGLPVDIANLNLAAQLVLAGRQSDLERLADPLRKAGAARVIPLNVSGAFHSRYMAPCAEAFSKVVRGVDFRPPKIPVIANVTARPYGNDIAALLVAQLRSPVRWADTMTFFREQGVTDLVELGPGKVLAKLWSQARADAGCKDSPSPVSEGPPKSPNPALVSPGLGSPGFCRAYGARHAYVVGSTTPGIRSPEMVRRAAGAGLPIYLDDYRPNVEQAVEAVRRELGPRGSFGVSLTGEVEQSVVDAAVEYDIRRGEAVGYRRVSPDLVRFRFQGLDGRPTGRRLMALVTSEYQADLFCRPAPEPIIEQLTTNGALSAAEADIARRSPVATDLCALCDTAEGGPLSTLLPNVLRRRDRLAAETEEPVYVGAGGAIGSPEAVACAFFLGADFVRTGAVNLACVESSLPTELRRALCELAPGETTSAPSVDGFALGARIQVMKKGSFFAARAQKLYELFRFHDGPESLNPKELAQLEKSIFKRPLDSVRQELTTQGTAETSADTSSLSKSTADPKATLAELFCWYLEQSLRWALEGRADRRLDFQIPCDESMAAFNRYAEGGSLQEPGSRRVVEVAERLLADARALLDAPRRD